MDRLKGKVAVITGASAGIGEGTAELFAKEGATVVLTARRVDRLDALAEKIKKAGGKALVVPGDVTEVADVRNVIEQTIKTFGKILSHVPNVAGATILSNGEVAVILHAPDLVKYGLALTGKTVPMALERTATAEELDKPILVVEDALSTARREDWSLETFLHHLLEQEMAGRRERRITRLTKAAHFPPGKTLQTFKQKRLPLRIRRQIPQLCAGEFIDRADNILVFGLPGTGKTHLVTALGYEWVQRNYSVLFIPTFKLVGGLLRAKRDYELERELRRLDRFQVVILDDLGYVQQSREEMEVLFTFLAERYERRSVVITSNLVFSEWDQIFKDPLTTAAAIDRVVHHSIIIEFGREMKSVRAEEAARRNGIRLVALMPPRMPRVDLSAWAFLVVADVHF